jgi:hypothetical protein
LITANLKDCSDEEIIGIIERIKRGQDTYDLDDLKNLLAEVTNRKLGGDYTVALNNLIKLEITSEGSSKKQPVPGKKSVAMRKIAPDSETEEERFPVLGFLTGIYKVAAWLSLVVCIIAGCVVGFVYLSDEILFVVASVLGGICLGTVLLLFFYSMSEGILLKLEMERHLRKMANK